MSKWCLVSPFSIGEWPLSISSVFKLNCFIREQQQITLPVRLGAFASKCVCTFVVEMKVQKIKNKNDKLKKIQNLKNKEIQD